MLVHDLHAVQGRVGVDDKLALRSVDFGEGLVSVNGRPRHADGARAAVLELDDAGAVVAVSVLLKLLSRGKEKSGSSVRKA